MKKQKKISIDVSETSFSEKEYATWDLEHNKILIKYNRIYLPVEITHPITSGKHVLMFKSHQNVESVPDHFELYYDILPGSKLTHSDLRLYFRSKDGEMKDDAYGCYMLLDSSGFSSIPHKSETFSTAQKAVQHTMNFIFEEMIVLKKQIEVWENPYSAKWN